MLLTMEGPHASCRQHEAHKGSDRAHIVHQERHKAQKQGTEQNGDACRPKMRRQGDSRLRTYLEKGMIGTKPSRQGRSVLKTYQEQVTPWWEQQHVQHKQCNSKQCKRESPRAV